MIWWVHGGWSNCSFDMRIRKWGQKRIDVIFIISIIIECYFVWFSQAQYYDKICYKIFVNTSDVTFWPRGTRHNCAENKVRVSHLCDIWFCLYWHCWTLSNLVSRPLPRSYTYEYTYVCILNGQLMIQRFKVHFHFIGNLCIPRSLSLYLWNYMYEKQPRIGDFRFWATRSQRSRQECRDLHNLIVHILENTCRHIIFYRKMKLLTNVMGVLCDLETPLGTNTIVRRK